MQDGILSIQSAVAYGHVGNSAAVFPLQRLGFEVWPVSTVLFSNHPGYGAWRGFVVPADQVRDIVAGIEERGAFPSCRALLSGYLGDVGLGHVVLETLSRIRSQRPNVVYACDPVMGDSDRGFFVRPGIPEFFRDHALSVADIVTPNQFELAWLAGREIASLDDALAAAAAVRAMGPELVCCTSLETPDRPGELAVLGDTAAGSWVVRTPRLDVGLNGTGDAFTALLLAFHLETGRADLALEQATSAMFAVVEATRDAGDRELQLVAAQDRLRSPPRRFVAERVR